MSSRSSAGDAAAAQLGRLAARLANALVRAVELEVVASGRKGRVYADDPRAMQTLVRSVVDAALLRRRGERDAEGAR